MEWADSAVDQIEVKLKSQFLELLWAPEFFADRKGIKNF